MSGRVERIWVKRTRQAVMAEAHEVRVERGKGIVGNADQGGWRQVTIIARERWDTLMRQVGASLDPSARRANLLVSGIDLEKRFIDQSPAEVHATLIEEQTYLCAPRTMYRVLAAAKEVRERRAQARHPVYTTPTRGRTLQIGDARLRIRGETRPCQQMDQAAPGLREAMRADGSGGVFAEVLTDSSIAVGDAARWADAADDAP